MAIINIICADIGMYLLVFQSWMWLTSGLIEYYAVQNKKRPILILDLISRLPFPIKLFTIMYFNLDYYRTTEKKLERLQRTSYSESVILMASSVIIAAVGMYTFMKGIFTVTTTSDKAQVSFLLFLSVLTIAQLVRYLHIIRKLHASLVKKYNK